MIRAIKTWFTDPNPVDFMAHYKDMRPAICKCASCGKWIYAGDGQMLGDIYYLLEDGAAFHRTWECTSQYLDSHYSIGGHL